MDLENEYSEFLLALAERRHIDAGAHARAVLLELGTDTDRVTEAMRTDEHGAVHDTSHVLAHLDAWTALVPV